MHQYSLHGFNNVVETKKWWNIGLLYIKSFFIRGDYLEYLVLLCIFQRLDN